VFRVLIRINADPDPMLYLHADPDYGFQIQDSRSSRFFAVKLK